jgi:hypothetical protein
MATDTASDTVTCTVCGEQAPVSATAECNWCSQPYHLNQRNDVEGKDCGQVWIDEQYLALQFACNTCLTGGDAGHPVAHTERDSTRPRKYKRRA